MLAARTIALDVSALGATLKPVPASDRVRFGMIGVGMQGSGLLANALTLAGVECVAAAELYDGRHMLGSTRSRGETRTRRP
jgi:predicted homoserine dehydrogenase-like protein